MDNTIYDYDMDCMKKKYFPSNHPFETEEVNMMILLLGLFLFQKRGEKGPAS